MEQVELTELTKEIINRLDNIKNCIKEEMIPGDYRMIRGVIFYEEVIKKINPSYIDEKVINEINHYIERALTEIYEKKQKIDHYFNYGIKRCQFMMYAYLVTVKKKIRK